MPYDPRYDGEPDDPRDLRSRTDARRERREAEERLLELANELVDLADRLREKLELPESVEEAVLEARRIKSIPARNRAVRTVRIALRDSEPERIRSALDRLLDPSRGGTAPRLLEHWRERLLSGGEQEIAAFVEAYPAADRKQIRQLVRNVSRAPDAERAEGLRKLSRAIERSVQG